MSTFPTATTQSFTARLFAKLTVRRLIISLIIGLILFAAISGYQRVRTAESEYQLAVRQIEQIQALASGDELYSMSQEDMAWLESEFEGLQGRIDNIEELSELPFGLEGAVGNAPWLSNRYQAAMDTLEVGRTLAEAGQILANVGEESLAALDDTGIRAESTDGHDTWLDVLQRREPDLNVALAKMDEATEKRASINDDHLPGGVRARLLQIDALMDSFSEQRQLARDLPLAFTALGADDTVRYLALFQNPAEVRPTGGFVGTIAFVEIERGQISSYEFHDVYEISSRYQERVDDGIDPPWALAEFVRPDYVQYQDANWWPHFPTTARNYIDITTVAGWGPIDSVVAVQPDAVSDLITITGPITVDVDGDDRVITPENLQDEAERQRRIERQGVEREAGHKEVVSLIGEVLLNHLSEGDRDDLIDAAFLVFDALDRRDMQAYHVDNAVQAFLEERNWAGQVHPDPGTPTIATAFANVTGLKTSLVMQPGMELELLESGTEGVMEATLTITMDHVGEQEADPFYEGFQRWWIDLMLPEKAILIDSTPRPADDPDASNGGSYVVDLDVGERKELRVRFSMPATERLLLRRQPGLQTMKPVVRQSGCDQALARDLDRDLTILLDGACPEFEETDADAYSHREHRNESGTE